MIGVAHGPLDYFFVHTNELGTSILALNSVVSDKLEEFIMPTLSKENSGILLLPLPVRPKNFLSLEIRLHLKLY